MSSTLLDPSTYPFCSPDWGVSSFVAQVSSAQQPDATYAIDFPCDMSIAKAMSLPICCAVVGLIFVIFLYFTLLKYPKGPETEEECNYDDPASFNNDENEYPATGCSITKADQIVIGKKMNRISGEVQEGATAFLKEEYFWLSLFVAFMFCVLLVLFTLDDNRTDRTDGIRISCSFLMGAILSASAGWIGMKVATDANVRTTQAARKRSDGGQDEGGLNSALRVAFTGGAVMGFVVVGLGLLGVSIFMLIMSLGRNCNSYESFAFGSTLPTATTCTSLGMEDALDSLAGFGFGASSIALFARVAGGIYTKAADVGADLVGKVEEDIPEDSPENPATIADNVGDNVGDVAGMGADLFESFVGSIIATATLADGDMAKISFPFWLAGAGIIASMFGFFAVRIGAEQEYRMTLNKAKDNEEVQESMFEVNPDNTTVKRLKKPYFEPSNNGVRTGEVWREDQPDEEQHTGGSTFVFDDNAQQADLMTALHKGTVLSSLMVCAFAAVICYFLFDYSDYQESNGNYYTGGPQVKDSEAWRLYGCVLIGLLCGILIGFATEYCTSYSYYPVKSIAKSGLTGPATVIIQGLGVGMISCFPPTFIIVATILACNALMAEYGVAVAAVSMLSTLGITLATDAYGPVADNAGGLAEMVEELPEGVRATTDALDALGNTTAATGKGFAIGSAVLTSLSLLNAFEDRVTGSTVLDTSVNDSIVLAGIVFGSMLPFLFGALTMISVGLAAQELIRAVREDFAVKKEEERAAIRATEAAPYKPWDYMGEKLSTDKNFAADTAPIDYYKGTVAGHPIPEGNESRSAALGGALAGFKGEFPADGFATVALTNVVRSEDALYADGTNDAAVSLSPFSLSKEAARGHGEWDERQSIFATKAWHSIRGWAPNSTKCIAISTKASIKEMLLPGVYAIFVPVFVGFLVGARCLMGVLAGSVGAGAMMAIMMSNAGGAWDNSKKYIEIAGAHGGKGTEIHKACVVGDTVGDPFKDTSGPALNILLKLMAVVSLTISTLLKGQDDWEIGYYAIIPFLFIVIATIVYVKFIYNQSDQAEAEPLDSPTKKKSWHNPGQQPPVVKQVEVADKQQSEEPSGVQQAEPAGVAKVEAKTEPVAQPQPEAEPAQPEEPEEDLGESEQF